MPRRLRHILAASANRCAVSSGISSPSPALWNTETVSAAITSGAVAAWATVRYAAALSTSRRPPRIVSNDCSPASGAPSPARRNSFSNASRAAPLTRISRRVSSNRFPSPASPDVKTQRDRTSSSNSPAEPLLWWYSEKSARERTSLSALPTGIGDNSRLSRDSARNASRKRSHRPR